MRSAFAIGTLAEFDIRPMAVRSEDLTSAKSAKLCEPVRVVQ